MARGPAGSIGGYRRGEADTMLVSLMIRLHSEHGLQVTRKQASEAMTALRPDMANQARHQFVKALFALPGSHAHADGETVTLPNNPVASVRHRHWRVQAGMVDAGDAARLHHLLENAEVLTPGLAAMRERMHNHLHAIAGPNWHNEFLP